MSKLLFSIVVLFLFPSAGLHADPTSLSDVDSSGRFLAGMDLDEKDSLFYLTQHDAWKTHNRSMNGSFNEFDRVFGQEMKSWTKSELSGSPGAVFYAFGGPDIFIPFILFPDANEFILFGMEPVGVAPNLKDSSEEKIARSYLTIRRALAWYLSFTYFQTYQMDRWLRGQDFGGAVPVIMVFLARSNARITSVTTLYQGGIPGARIDFQANGIKKSVYYFTINASDASLARTPQFLDFVRSRGPRASFLKASSYLMHGDGFSIMRNFIVKESNLILSDDAGLPFRSYNPNEMKLSLYGRYIAPMPMYRNLFQQDIKDACSAACKPLAFDIGYTTAWRRRASILVLARKK